MQGAGNPRNHDMCSAGSRRHQLSRQHPLKWVWTESRAPASLPLRQNTAPELIHVRVSGLAQIRVVKTTPSLFNSGLEAWSQRWFGCILSHRLRAAPLPVPSSDVWCVQQVECWWTVANRQYGTKPQVPWRP